MFSRVFMSMCSVALILAVTACGSSSNGNGSTAPAVTAEEVANAGGQIAIAGWQYYQSPKVQDAGPVKSTWTYLASGPDILTKARSGEFDVVSTASESMSGMKALEVALPIDTSLIPNYEKITPRLREDDAWKNSAGEVIAVPFSDTASLTAFDTSQVAVATNLADLLKPEFAHGIALFGDPSIIGQIAMAQGVDNTEEMTKADLARAMEYLEELKPNVKTFFLPGEEVQLFNSGSIVACIGTFGTIIAKAIEANPAIKYNFLAGGSFVNAWSIVGPNHVAASLNWINRTLTPAGQRAIVEASGDYPAVPAAVPSLQQVGDPVSAALGEFSLNELLEEEPIFRGYSAEPHGDIVGIDEVTRAFNEYKSSF